MSAVAKRAELAFGLVKKSLEAQGKVCSYRSLEAEFGLPNAAIQKLVKGDRASPRPENARRIADALRVSVSWLFEGIGDGPVGEPSTTSQPATFVESPDRYPQVTEFVAVMLEHGATEDEATRFRSRVALLKSAEGPSVDDLAELWRTMQVEHKKMVEHATKIYQRAPVKDANDPFGAPRGALKGRR